MPLPAHGPGVAGLGWQDHARGLALPTMTRAQDPGSCPALQAAAGSGLETGAQRPPRVVIDSAVVTSALVFGGAPSARLRRAWKSGFCRPMVCKSTLLDLIRQLGHDRLGFGVPEQQQMLGEYLPYVLKVRLPVAAPTDAAEPAGLIFVQLALAGRAHVLVSSDPALLALGDRLPFTVLALEPFLDWLRTTPITPAPLRVAPRPASQGTR
jgi:predicted nucleic acid-binding protein